MKNERNEGERRSPLEEGQRNTEIKRETEIRDSLGPVQGTDAEEKPKVTPESDVFKDEKSGGNR